MGAKKRADLMPEIRGGLKRHFAIMAERGKPLSDIWDELYKKDIVSYFKMAIACQPKEQNINLQTETTIKDIPAIDWELLRQAKADAESKQTH